MISDYYRFPIIINYHFDIMLHFPFHYRHFIAFTRRTAIAETTTITHANAAINTQNQFPLVNNKFRSCSLMCAECPNQIVVRLAPRRVQKCLRREEQCIDLFNIRFGIIWYLAITASEKLLHFNKTSNRIVLPTTRSG